MCRRAARSAVRTIETTNTTALDQMLLVFAVSFVLPALCAARRHSLVVTVFVSFVPFVVFVP